MITWGTAQIATKQAAGASRRIALLATAVIVGSAGFAVSSAQSALATTTCTVSWTGAGANNEWTTVENWSTGSVPGATDNVCVDNGVTLPLINGDVTILNLEVSQGIVIVNAPATLTVTNAVTSTAGIALNGGTLTAGSIDISGSGSIDGSQDTSTIDTAAFRVHGAADVLSQLGTLKFTHDPLNLSNNVLSGGAWIAQANGVIQMPSDIHTLDAAVALTETGPSYFVNASNTNSLSAVSKITQNGSLSLGNGASLSTPGPLQALGSLSFSGSSATLTTVGALTASAQLNMDAGAGTISAPTVTLTKTAQFNGVVRIKGNLVNNGTMQTGSPLAEQAAGGHVFTQVTGRYTQSSTGRLSPVIVNNQVSTLKVSGAATLNGQLNFNGTGPVGKSYPIVTAASRTGKFATFTFGSPPKYTTKSVAAVVTTQIQAARSVVHGKQFPVEGVNFPGTKKVTFYLDKVAGPGIGSVTTGSDGFFFTPVRMPAATSHKVHTLIAMAAGGKPKLSQKITVK